MGPALALGEGALASRNADLLIAILFEKPLLFDETPFRAQIAAARKEFGDESVSAEKIVALSEGFGAPFLMIVNGAATKGLSQPEKVAAAVSKSIDAATARGFRKLVILFDRGGEYLTRAVNGVVLGSYGFQKYKSKKKEKNVDVVIYAGAKPSATVKKQFEAALELAACVNECRDIVNEPANVADTDALVAEATKVAKACGLEIEILEKKELEKRGYNGLLTVGRAGHTPPRMIILKYKPSKESKKHLCIVGKGIVFDTGGISIKSAAGMWTMKGDMAGAAAALYGIKAISRIKPAFAVSAILCVAENMADTNAVRPGDIFIAANGKSVHVDNTDAEGRLVLSDGLHMAGKLSATHIVNLATLTGACVVALGERIAGAMGNDDKWTQKVLDAGKAAGESLWHLPLPDEYREMLDIYCADINNTSGGSRYGGALTAGLFLREFVPENTPWVHLDIAGPAFFEKKWKYFAEGATGFGVRTLAELVRQL